MSEEGCGSNKGFDDGGDHNNGLLHLSEEFGANDEVHPATTHFVNNFIKVSRRDSISSRFEFQFRESRPPSDFRCL